MPVATKKSGTTRYELKSLPEGYVVLQRMSYGESVERRAMMKFSIDAAPGTKDVKGEFAMASIEIQALEFRACVVEHNLTDEADRPLDFMRVADMKNLDSKVGQEIEQLISKENDFNEDEEGNSESGAPTSSSETEEATN